MSDRESERYMNNPELRIEKSVQKKNYMKLIHK
jgi:hypothetical protein